MASKVLACCGATAVHNTGCAWASVPYPMDSDTEPEFNGRVEVLRNMLWSQRMPLSYTNGYPIEAVPWAAVLDVLAIYLVLTKVDD